jgi:hypothetical protein
VQSDGKIVVGGASAGDFAVARFNADGSPDQAFGKAGKQITEVTEGDDGINDIAISRDKLYVAGTGRYIGSLGVIARYLLNDDTENKPPTVSLSIPYNIVKYASPAWIKLNATSTDEDGKITKVQFFNGTTRLHTEDVYPYGFLWIDVPVGNYTLTAKAFDDSGNVATSNSINVSVVEENVPPVVSIVRPVDDTTYTGFATIKLIAKAKDPNDKISKVEFYNGTALIRTEYYYPYTYTWNNLPAGTYTITAKAYDDKGLSAVSEPVTVTVSSIQPIVKAKRYSVTPKHSNSTLRVTLSPNPVTNMLNIRIEGGQLNQQATISILSASGVVVKTIPVTALDHLMSVDVSSLARGVYVIKVVNGDRILEQQFVKL